MRLFRTGRFRLLSGLIALLLTLTPAFAEVNYTVRAGDSLPQIARRFSVPLRTLCALNHLRSHRHLHVGRIIRIPEKAAPSTAPAPSAAPVSFAAPAPSASPAPPQQVTAIPQAPSATSSVVAPARQLTGRELIAERTRLVEEQAHRSGVVSSAQALTGAPYEWGG